MLTPQKRAIAVFLLVGLLAGAVAEYVGAFDPPDSALTASPSPALSSYWSYQVLRWEDLIVEEADRRSLDPDLLAALVWQESRGDSDAVGPKGAVGLTQVMPKEAGFTWRPSHESLTDPSVNLFWGTRTLATVIRQGHGDVFHALAAYNGGWDQVSYNRPRRFAMTILRDYARAVAFRYGAQGRWVAFFAIDDLYIRGPIWVADSSRTDVYLYGQSNYVFEGMPLIPAIPPVSVVATGESTETGRAYRVGIWLYNVEAGTWNSFGHAPTPALVPPTPVATHTPSVTPTPTPASASTATPTAAVPLATPTVSPSATPPASAPHTTVTPTPSATPTVAVTPTPSAPATSGSQARVLDGAADLRPGPTRWWDPTETLPPDTLVELLGYDIRFPEWVYVRTFDETLEGWTQAENLQFSATLKQLPLVTPQPTLTPTTTATTTPTPTPTIACTGDALWAEAWAMEKRRGAGESWTAVIYAVGHGGNCMYTYSWNVDEEQGPTTSSVFFEITVDRPEPILGMVNVTSGDETVSVGVHVLPP